VLQKMGGVPLDQSEVVRLVEVAVEKAKEVEVLIEGRLKEDWMGRGLDII
jgi:exosome complex component RRP45